MTASFVRDIRISVDAVCLCRLRFTVRAADGDYVEVQHGDNPEAQRAFDLRLSDEERTEQLLSWLKEIHEHERR